MALPAWTRYWRQLTVRNFKFKHCNRIKRLYKWLHLSSMSQGIQRSNSPEWIPTLSCSCCPGRCLILKVAMADSKSRDMLLISPACLFPFLVGSPEATMYESPIVSTLISRKWKNKSKELPILLLRTCSAHLEMVRESRVLKEARSSFSGLRVEVLLGNRWKN